jgi:hypothetical protein
MGYDSNDGIDMGQHQQPHLHWAVVATTAMATSTRVCSVDDKIDCVHDIDIGLQLRMTTSR